VVLFLAEVYVELCDDLQLVNLLGFECYYTKEQIKQTEKTRPFYFFSWSDSSV